MKIKAIIFAISALTVSACSSDVQVNHTAHESNKETKDFIGKMTAPIEVSYTLSKDKYAVGENISVDISLTSNVKKTISTKLNASKNLSLVSSESSWSSELNKSGVRQNQPSLQFVAEKEGKFYIDFVATVEVDGQMMGKAFSIPVQVGESGQQEGNYEIDDKGQKVKVHKLKNDN